MTGVDGRLRVNESDVEVVVRFRVSSDEGE